MLKALKMTKRKLHQNIQYAKVKIAQNFNCKKQKLQTQIAKSRNCTEE